MLPDSAGTAEMSLLRGRAGERDSHRGAPLRSDGEDFVTLIVYIVVYLLILTFIIRCLTRAMVYANAPAHLRWELYPVPHEAPQRAGHGGSYFEETDWWKKPGSKNLTGEMKMMVPEMLFLQGLWEFNRKLWWRSFPFHFGLYLCLLSLFLLALRAVLSVAVPGAGGGALATAWTFAYQAAGVLGAVLVIAGAGGLLLRRLLDSDLRVYTTPADIFNLAFFACAFAALLGTYALRPAKTVTALDFARGLLTFETGLAVPPAMAGAAILGFLLAAYIPFTHMSHFIAKYFTYHSIRWDDVPVARRKGLEKKVAEYLTYRPSWAARHVGADGRKTWVDIATSAPQEKPAKGAKR